MVDGYSRPRYDTNEYNDSLTCPKRREIGQQFAPHGREGLVPKMPSSHERSLDHGDGHDYESDAHMSVSGSAGHGSENDENDEEESGAPGVPGEEKEYE